MFTHDRGFLFVVNLMRKKEMNQNNWWHDILIDGDMVCWLDYVVQQNIECRYMDAPENSWIEWLFDGELSMLARTWD